MAAAEPTKGVALVTGAARRIGRAIALRCARDGYAVAVHCRRARAEADAVRREIETAGGRAVVIVADLAEPDACARTMREAATMGVVTLLVNNASLFEPDAAEDFSTASWNAHFNVNLRAPALLARDMAAALPQDRDGAIVNILDQRIAKLTPHFFSYTLAKAALHTATHVLAQSFAPHIRVNAVAPGPTFQNARQRPEDFARQADGTVLGRAVAVADIADAVIYLANAGSVTGQTLFVDAGQRLAWRTPDVDGVRE